MQKKINLVVFLHREKLRMKRQKIIEESDDSDEVNFPESMFNEGGEVGSDMDFEVGTIQSPPERCTFFVHYIFFILFPED